MYKFFNESNYTFSDDYHFYDDPLCVVGVVPNFLGLGIEPNTSLVFKLK